MGNFEKKSFVFNCEWLEVLEDYPEEVRLEVYEAVIRYAASGTLSELKPLAKMAFSFIKKEVDYNNERYSKIVAKRSEAGKKGMGVRYAHEGDQPQEDEDVSEEVTNPNKTNKCYQEVTKLTNANKGYQTLTSPNKINYNDNDNDIIIKPPISPEGDNPPLEGESTQKVRRRFVKPTVDYIRAYCAERGNSIDAQAFCDFYESKGWRVGSSPMKDWKAAVRTWEKRGEYRHSPSMPAPSGRPDELRRQQDEAERGAREILRKRYGSTD